MPLVNKRKRSAFDASFKLIEFSSPLLCQGCESLVQLEKRRLQTHSILVVCQTLLRCMSNVMSACCNWQFIMLPKQSPVLIINTSFYYPACTVILVNTCSTFTLFHVTHAKCCNKRLISNYKITVNLFIDIRKE